MKVTLLLACMHEKDTSIIQRNNVQSDVVVVNQCDYDSIEEFDFVNEKGKTCHAKFICTTERGLSRSRNMAIRNAWGDVCIICDDDEWMADDCVSIIEEIYNKNPSYDVITFALDRKDRPTAYSQSEYDLRLSHILNTCSLQITFKRESVVKNGIMFDVKIGSGTGNGGGEENRFLLDCRKKGLCMKYNPSVIATINPGNSQWFKGLTSKFFRDRGWVTHRNLGFFVGYAYLWYNVLNHRKDFTKDGLSLLKVIWYMHKGFFEKR